MERATFANPANLSLIEEYLERWQNDPSSVDASWRIFFEGFELGRRAPSDGRRSPRSRRGSRRPPSRG